MSHTPVIVFGASVDIISSRHVHTQAGGPDPKRLYPAEVPPIARQPLCPAVHSDSIPLGCFLFPVPYSLFPIPCP